MYFAPIPSPMSVRRVLLCAAWNDLRVESEQTLPCDTFARPPKLQEKDGWIWRLHGTMNGIRTASRDFFCLPGGCTHGMHGFLRVKNWDDVFLHESNERRPAYLCKTCHVVQILNTHGEVGSYQER